MTTTGAENFNFLTKTKTKTKYLMLYVTRNKLTNAPPPLPLPEKYYKKINKTHNVRKESLIKSNKRTKYQIIQ